MRIDKHFAKVISFPRVREYFRHFLSPGFALLLFPARAGVFPANLPSYRLTIPLSRACGSISSIEHSARQVHTSFPRVREYFLASPPAAFVYHLFPARAGVFPSVATA